MPETPEIAAGDNTRLAGMIWPARELLFLFTALLIFAVVLYWRTLFTNFVYDDWLVLDELHRTGPLASLMSHFDPRATLVYRPLAWVYFSALYAAFGLSPLPFHIIALLMHTLNGVLVAMIGTDLMGRRLPAILGGTLFVALVSLHIETLLWLVGFYDIGAMTFGLLGIHLLNRGRVGTSAAMMACALLTKEAAAFLPFLLALWMWLMKRPLRVLAPHAIITMIYAGLKLLGLSPFSVSERMGHAMAASGATSSERLLEYLRWLLDAFLPLLLSRVPTILLGFLVVSIIAFWLTYRRQLHEKAAGFVVIILLTWIFLALAPTLLLINQWTRYYTVHAAIPTALMAAMIVSELSDAYSVAVQKALMALIVVVVSIANVHQGEALFSLGLRQFIINDGYFHLNKRAAIVDAIHDSLMTNYPRLPHGSAVVVAGVSLDAVGGNRAVRLWYGDSTLQMIEGFPAGRNDGVHQSEEKDSFVVFIDLSNRVTAREE